MIAAADRPRVEARLAQLREEMERGGERLAAIEADGARVRETMLRIAGAVQVLTEILAEPAPEAAHRDETDRGPDRAPDRANAA